MVGIAISTNASLREIADACKDYDLPDSLTSYKNVYLSDGTRAGAGTTSNPIKFSQFAGKSVMYQSTNEQVLSTHPWYNSYLTTSVSRNCNYYAQCYLGNSYLENPFIYDKNGNSTQASFGTAYWWQREGSDRIAISDDGKYLVYRAVITYYFSDTNTNQQRHTFYVFYRSSASSTTWNYFRNDNTIGFDREYGLGSAFGDIVVYNGLVYIPTRWYNAGPYLMSIIYTFDPGNPNNALGVFGTFIAEMLQISSDTSRVVTTTGGYVNVYRYDQSGTQIYEANFSGAEGSVYIDDNCSTILSGTNVWHRNGTTWTQADTSEIVTYQDYPSSPFLRRLSADGLRIITVEYDDNYGGDNTPQVFQYSPLKNKWYHITNTVNLDNVRETRFAVGQSLGHGGLGISNDGRVFLESERRNNYPGQMITTDISLKK